MSNSLDANVEATSAGIQVSAGLSSLQIPSSPDQFPSGTFKAGTVLVPPPRAILKNSDLETLHGARIPVFLTATDAQGQVQEIVSEAVEESCCRQADCAAFFPFTVSDLAARCCNCSMLQAMRCDPCVMVHHDRSLAAAATGAAGTSRAA